MVGIIRGSRQVWKKTPFCKIYFCINITKNKTKELIYGMVVIIKPKINPKIIYILNKKKPNKTNSIKHM